MNDRFYDSFYNNVHSHIITFNNKLIYYSPRTPLWHFEIMIPYREFKIYEQFQEYLITYVCYAKFVSERQWIDIIENHAHLFRFCREQTEEICLAAVKQDTHFLKYVKEQTFRICFAACLRNPHCAIYIKEDKVSLRILKKISAMFVRIGF